MSLCLSKVSSELDLEFGGDQVLRVLADEFCRRSAQTSGSAGSAGSAAPVLRPRMPPRSGPTESTLALQLFLAVQEHNSTSFTISSWQSVEVGNRGTDGGDKRFRCAQEVVGEVCASSSKLLRHHLASCGFKWMTEMGTVPWNLSVRSSLSEGVCKEARQ